MRFVSPISLPLAIGCSLLAACAGVKQMPGGGTGGNGGGPATGFGGSGAPRPDGGVRVDPPSTMPPKCGNGERTSDEACDDGNTVGGDGCSADCKTVEPGFSCTPAGKPCHRVARCGDGVVVPPELCDDGNTTDGDGCSSTCKIELGHKCSGSPSVCTTTKCGDGVIEGAETCEDGNTLPFDGCSADCQSEPNCKSGACTSKCGDGVVVGEACDDGNNIDGDGCSATCQIEPGYMCSQPALGDKMSVPAIFRDFKMHMPTDFEPSSIGQSMVVTGMVQAMLDTDGKPVYTGNVNNSHTTTATFAEWYRDTLGTNHTTSGKIALYNNGQGAFVNRWGPNGEQWSVTTMAYYCGNVGREMLDPATGLPIPCTVNDGSNTNCTTFDAMGYKQLQCNIAGGSYSAIYQTALLDGTPVFFPVDSDTFSPASEATVATIPPPYEPTGSYPQEMGMPKHNFSFTSEVRYWFKFDATKSYKLDFTGDDDVWVFVNKKLAVDLGGIHTAQQGSVTLNATTANTYGLKDGSVYEVALFQAERQTTSSTYKLTLSGFNAAASGCRPVCGDGILGIGEECDDGAANNTGGYGRCNPDCTLGAYCGDSIVQTDEEDCDDGINDGHPCPSGCRNLVIPP